MKIQITKMHGLGNDFVMIDNMEGHIKLTISQIRAICDRHMGIGADGVILMEKREGVDCFMNYFNSDGSFAEICGNGIRCLARFFIETTKTSKTILLIGTRAGTKEVVIDKEGNYSVVMGNPVFVHHDFPKSSLIISRHKFELVSVGNPHAVTFVDDLDNYNISHVGQKVENDKHFPNKINVEFVEKIGENKFKVKVWERGCGITLACGTGATAVYAIVRKMGMINDKVVIELPGGILNFSENNKGEIIMSGPATNVFQTSYDL